MKYILDSPCGKRAKGKTPEAEQMLTEEQAIQARQQFLENNPQLGFTARHGS